MQHSATAALHLFRPGARWNGPIAFGHGRPRRTWAPYQPTKTSHPGAVLGNRLAGTPMP